MNLDFLTPQFVQTQKPLSEEEKAQGALILNDEQLLKEQIKKKFQERAPQSEMTQVPQSVDATPVSQSPSFTMPSQDPLEAQIQALLNKKSMAIDGQRGDLEKLQGEAPSAFSNLDLTPMMAWADNMSGRGNLAQSYRAPTVKKEWEGKVDKLKAMINQGDNALIDDNISLLREKLRERLSDKRMAKAMNAIKGSSGLGYNLTPGQKKLDETFAKDWNEWNKGGDRSNFEKQIEQLEQAANSLDADSSLTGAIRGQMPDALRVITNPTAIATRDAVRTALQSSLKATLGAQFTEKEGQKIEQRGFDERLSGKENAKRIRREIEALRKRAAAKDQSGQYFEQYGTLSGMGAASGVSKPKSIIQNGHEYILNEETGEYE